MKTNTSRFRPELHAFDERIVPATLAITDAAMNTNDDVAITRNGSFVTVTQNGTTTTRLMNDATNTITVDMKNGANTLRVNSLRAGDVVQVKNSMYGKDAVIVGNGSLSSVQGRVDVSNGSGQTNMQMNDSGNTVNRQYETTGTSFRTDGRTVATFNAGGVTGGVNHLNLLAGATTDPARGLRNVHTVSDIPAGMTYRQDHGYGSHNHVETRRVAGRVEINGSGGNDYVNVHADGSLASRGGQVAVSNASGQSQVHVRTNGSATAVNGTAAVVHGGPAVSVAGNHATTTLTLFGITPANPVSVEGTGGAQNLYVHVGYQQVTDEQVVFGSRAKAPNVFVSRDVVR